MKKLVLILGLVSLCLPLGCGSAHVRYDAMLTRAENALREGDVERAERVLNESFSVAEECGANTGAGKLLLAEAKLQKGDFSTSLVEVNSVLEAGNTDPATAARAKEIIGKIAIRQGEFAVAQTHLSGAERTYDSESDRRRVADLIALARGLTAYSKGDIAVARKYWHSIMDAELRFSIDQCVQDAASAAKR